MFSCFNAGFSSGSSAHFCAQTFRFRVFLFWVFFFSPKGVDVLISLWITIVVIGYHVHGYCCHDSFLISHTSFLIFWLCFLQTSVPCCVSFSFFSPPHRPFVSLSRSDWGIIAKLNTFRAIAHFLSFPPCDVRTFQRAFPQGLLTSCLSHACDWLTLCFIGLNLHALHLRCNNLPFIIRPFFLRKPSLLLANRGWGKACSSGQSLNGTVCSCFA